MFRWLRFKNHIDGRQASSIERHQSTVNTLMQSELRVCPAVYCCSAACLYTSRMNRLIRWSRGRLLWLHLLGSAQGTNHGRLKSSALHCSIPSTCTNGLVYARCPEPWQWSPRASAMGVACGPPRVPVTVRVQGQNMALVMRARCSPGYVSITKRNNS